MAESETTLGSTELSAGQEAELRQLGAVLRSRSPLFGAELDRLVMARIRRSPRARLLALRSWWLRPRLIELSPLSALLGAGAVAVLLLIGIRQFRVGGLRETQSLAVQPVVPPIQAVQFVLAAPGASQVNLVGDFNGWDSAATPLKPVGAAGVWAVEVWLPSGRHEYAFVVDGREWRSDPAAPRALANDYGAPNSVITVGARSL
jgi:hypothetical protein